MGQNEGWGLRSDHAIGVQQQGARGSKVCPNQTILEWIPARACKGQQAEADEGLLYVTPGPEGVSFLLER